MAEEELVTVSHPEKVGEGISQYVTYAVRSGPSEVRRRFRDFKWLYDALVAAYPGAVVPPAPEKVQLGRFETPFLRARCRALARFLKRIFQNAELAKSQELSAFLTASDDEFQAEKVSKRGSQGPNAVTDAKEQVGFWLQQTMSAAGTALTKGIKQVSGEATVEQPSVPPESEPKVEEDGPAVPWETDPDLLEFSAHEEAAASLELQLTNVARHASSVLVRQREWAATLRATGETFKMLSDAETDRTSPLFHDMGFTLERAGGAGEGSGFRLLQGFVEPLQDAARFVRGIKVALAQRVTARKAATQAASRVRARQQHWTRIKGQPEKQDKAQQAEAAVREAEAWLTEATENVGAITDRLRGNLQQFQEQYMAEIQVAMQNYAALQLKMAQELHSTWEKALEQFDAPQPLKQSSVNAVAEGEEEKVADFLIGAEEDEEQEEKVGGFPSAASMDDDDEEVEEEEEGGDIDFSV